MVVASIGWVQNTNYSLLNQIENNNMNTTVYDNNTTNNNNNINNNTNNNNNNNKMSAKGMLICRDNSHAFQDRTLNLDEAVKIGRSVARTRASIDNAIFDCKVLSRNHAQLWYKNGKFYLQDTGSSNGTFVNNQRLSTTGSESKAKEVCSGDIVQFGVDVIESTKKVTHGCIIATLKLYLPDGKEAISNRSMYVTRQADVTLEDLYKLNQYVQEASRREKVLQSKLTHLQKLVDNMKVSASQSWKALIDEDRLLSRVKTVESQLVAYSKNFTEDKIRNELVKLEEEKSQYQIVAKDTLQKVHQEKIELSQKIMHLECRLNETEDECQSLHDISKNTQLELQELAVKYTTSQKNLLQLEVSCNEKEQNNIDLIKTHEQEKQDIIDKLKQHNKIEIYLKNKLKQYRIDRINIHKQLTILKNYLQPSFNNDGTIIDASTNIIPNSIMDTINITLDDILNESSNIDIDNIDDSLENLINLQSNDSNEKLTSTSIADTTTTTTTTNSSITTATERSNSYEKNDDIDNNNDNEDNDDDEEETNNREIHAEYILPPTSRRTLVNGKINVENDNDDDDDDDDNDDDDCSEISGQTCIINDKNNSINDRNGDDDDDDGDDTSDEKSIIENKKIDDVINRDINKLEVRFASDVNGEQLETIHYDKDDKNNNNDDDDEDDDGDDGDGDETGQGDDSSDSADSPNASFSSVTATDGNDDKDDCIEKCEEWKIDDDEEEEDGEHLEDSISQCHTTNNIERKKNVQLINPMKRKLEEFQIVNKMAGGTSTSNGDSSQNRICRDFLRNVCHRGKRCKYIHERTHDNPIDEYTFCHDYQNGMCNWPGCKFLHCTENEEKHFRTTGELPAHIINRIKNINNDVNKIELPVCKDFIKGSCQRLNCKFRHYKKDEVQNNNTNNNINNNNNNNNNNSSNCSNTIQPHINPPRSQQHFNGNNNNNVNGDQRHFEEDRNYHWQIEDQHPMIINSGYNASPHPGDYLSPPEPKRRIISGETVLHFETSPQLVGQQITSGYYYPVIARNEARSFVLEDENSLLRKKIDELKKKVSDLTATNEFLLDQNAQLRMSGKRTTSVTAVTVPAVTITPTQAPTPQQMVNAAVAAGTLRTVTASVATVPVSIATVTPVSIAAVSMAPVSIPQPIVTMAQQTITMSGVGPQQNNQQQQNSQQTNNLPLSLSGATGLSYPIMTQELRPVLQ